MLHTQTTLFLAVMPSPVRETDVACAIQSSQTFPFVGLAKDALPARPRDSHLALRVELLEDVSFSAADEEDQVVDSVAQSAHCASVTLFMTRTQRDVPTRIERKVTSAECNRGGGFVFKAKRRSTPVWTLGRDQLPGAAHCQKGRPSTTVPTCW